MALIDRSFREKIVIVGVTLAGGLAEIALHHVHDAEIGRASCRERV